MDNIRFALLCAFGVVLFFLYQAWQADYGKQQAPPAPEPVTAQRADTGVHDLPPVPQTEPEQKTDAAAQHPPPAQASLQPPPGGKTIQVFTDRLAVTIDLRGGDLRRVALLGVPVSSERPESDLNLLSDTPPNFFIAQSGLISPKRSAPDHGSPYTAPRTEYHLREGQDKLIVPLVWTAPDGRKVTKIYTFYRDSYRVGLRYEIENASGQPWTVSPYLRFWRTPYQHSGDMPFSSSFMGVGWYAAEPDEGGYSYATRALEDLPSEPVAVTQEGGWLAMVQHYFVAAVIPPPDRKVSYFAKPKPLSGFAAAAYGAGYVGAAHQIAPQQHAVIPAQLFLGPKLQDRLGQVAPGLELTVDYGIFTFLARPLYWVLEKLYALVGNWGWAIVLLTIIIKLIFYKLSETQYRAMARMRKFAPRLQQIKEQYGDDRAKLQEKMMDLYKKEGFNPLGGCWPLLVQTPVFIALYWVLRASVELRFADWILWIDDLSAPDPYYILPCLLGVIMFIQQRLSASSMTMEPMQQRMMQIMPIGMAVFFAFFPVGLVLYYVTNSLLSIAQQWYIYRKLDNEGLGHHAGAK